MRAATDLQLLMSEAKSGSLEAFDELYEQLVPFVFQIAFKILKDKREAEDVCHNVFIEVYRRPQSYHEDQGSVKAWMAVKTKSRSLDYLRKKRQVVVENAEEHGHLLFTSYMKSTEDWVLSHLEKESLQTALRRIPAAQREAVYNKYFRSCTQMEIAEQMNRPVGTIKSLLRYGVRNLRIQLQQLGWYDGRSEDGDHHVT